MAEPQPTQLELAAQALQGAIAAFTYPSDLQARDAACVSFAQLGPGIDYLAAVHGVLTAKVEPAREASGVVLDALSPAARDRLLEGELATARWALVDHAANIMHELSQRGHLPRHDVDQHGNPVDGLGIALNTYDDYRPPYGEA